MANKTQASTHPFAIAIQQWYDVHQRSLPWRETQDPYRIWISEIILQQTQVVQGLAYYYRFIEAFPNVEALASAPVEHVLKLWQGLGYYSRARNLHIAAQQIVEMGGFPKEYDQIRSLKGVGDYTASAIASFAFGACTATVDGNVYRVLARYFGIELPIDKGEGQRFFKALATELIDQHTPARFNQAMMEFGALQCTPKGYDCMQCPLAEGCVALAKGVVDQLPVKIGKVKVRKRYFAYYFIRLSDGRQVWYQRKAKDIWQGLFEPYLVEREAPAYEGDAMIQTLCKVGECEPIVLTVEKKHVLSHQHIYGTFYTLQSLSVEVDVQWLRLLGATAIIVPPNEVESYAVPRLVEWGYEQWQVQSNHLKDSKVNRIG